MKRVATVAAALGCFGATAHAASTIDLIEHLFGASNINGVVGNGRMTIGISPLGDGAVLSWPSPSYTDQLLHLGRNDLDVRATRVMAAAESMGTWIGVRLKVDGQEMVVFPRDDWDVRQSFPDPRSARMQTTCSKAAEPFIISIEDHVVETTDVWLRKVIVTPVAGAVLTDVQVLGYWNLSPTLSRVPQLPLADWAMDAFNDYAAAWSEADQALIHYRPAGRGDITAVANLVVRPDIDFGPVGAVLTSGGATTEEVAAEVVDQIKDEPAGVYLAIASDAPVVGHQVGFDRTQTCLLLDALADNIKALPTSFPGLTLPLDPALVDVLRCDATAESLAAEQGWLSLPRSAYEDIEDGVLGGANLAAGQVDTALAVEAIASGTSFAATFRVGAGATFAQAMAAAGTTSGAWLSLPAQTRLPADPEVTEVAARALVNLLLAQDKLTGAIVASVSRQAPYALDWPRDGAFFTAALDVAGLEPLATKRVPWVLSTQRLEAVPAEPLINLTPPTDPDTGRSDTYPAGAWEMNYYADGLVGGNIRWEIDNTGLVVWSLIDHARYLEGAERTAHEAQIFPAVARASELLARWKDPATGLHAATSEDDNAVYTQTLHGAITTWAALDAAARLASTRPDLDGDARGAGWSARADELRAAILTHLVDPVTHRFKEGLNEAQNPGNAAGGPSAWALWPARFLRDDMPAEVAIREATEAWLLELAETRLDPKNGGSAYLAKLLVAVAIATKDEARRTKTAELLVRLATTTSTPDTHVFGEVFVGVDANGNDGANEVAFSARVSNPHVWAGTLVYLAAMALEAPERFDDPLATTPEPEAEVAEVVEPGPRSNDDGCGAGGLSLGAAALLLLARSSRKRA